MVVILVIWLGSFNSYCVLFCLIKFVFWFWLFCEIVFIILVCDSLKVSSFLGLKVIKILCLNLFIGLIFIIFGICINWGLIV